MISLQTLLEILEVAVHAPSGHNYQPWSFSHENDVLRVSLKRVADPTIYNYQERGSLVAIGALLESIRIYAPTKGFSAQYRYVFGECHDVVAEVMFKEGSHETSPLAAALLRRVTNRRPYEARQIIPESREALLASAESTPASIRLVDDPAQKGQLAAASIAADSLMLTHPAVRSAIFQHVIWTKAEEQTRKEGLYVKTLELEPPAEFFFGLFGKFPLLARFMGALGFGSVIARDTEARYLKGGEFAVIGIPDFSDRSCFELGRALLRLWTTATLHGLSVQPIGAVLFLAVRARDNDGTFTGAAQKRLIKAADVVAKVAAFTDAIPGIMCRIGYAPPPSATSSRKAPILS